MKTLILFAHPWKGSFNRALLDHLMAGLREGGHSIDLVDLFQDGFNPILLEQDLALYSKGQSTDPLVASYQKRMEEAEQLYILVPIWWTGMPALLKGFFDKVLLKGWAYDTAAFGLLKGRLSHIRQATVISTMNAPGWYYTLFMGNVLKHEFIRGCLQACGIKKVRWMKLGSVVTVSPEKRKAWLEKVARLGKK